MKIQTIIAALLSVLLLGGAVFVATQNLGILSERSLNDDGTEVNGEVTAHPASIEESSAAVVTTAVAVERELQGEVRLNGEILAEITAVAYPDTAGTLKRMVVTPGQYVREGQTLATVDPSRPGAQYEESPVVAPISGYITSVHIDRGSAVSPTAGIATVATLDDLKIVVQVPERYVTSVRPGMGATFTTFALGDRNYDALVVEIEPVVDPATRSKEVRLKVVGDASDLQPGMFTRISLPVRRSGRAVTVPFSALVQEAGKTYVYAVVEGRAERREVQVGLIARDYVAISGGIDAGTEVVMNGVQKVQDHGAVRIAGTAGENN